MPVCVIEGVPDCVEEGVPVAVELAVAVCVWLPVLLDVGEGAAREGLGVVEGVGERVTWRGLYTMRMRASTRSAISRFPESGSIAMPTGECRSALVAKPPSPEHGGPGRVHRNVLVPATVRMMPAAEIARMQ